jgi:hypothetical protein
MVELSAAVFDVILAAAHAEHVRHEPCGWAVGVVWRNPKPDAVVSQDRMDLVRHGCDKGCKEGRGGDAVGFVDQL